MNRKLRIKQFLVKDTYLLQGKYIYIYVWKFLNRKYITKKGKWSLKVQKQWKERGFVKKKPETFK